MDCRGGLHRPRFFKVLLPGFETQLQFPRAFVKKHITKEDEKARMATLSCPNGKVLHVSLHETQQDLYFSGDKWRACTQVLNLKVGYFLLFSYEANMHFSFIVLGHSNCEKTYLPSRTYVSSETPVVKMSTATCRDGHCYEIITQCHGPITSYCKDCKCARFETIVSNVNLTKFYMRIPVSFMELSGLSVEHNKLFLVNSEERSWLVKLRHVGEKIKTGSDTRMGLGWNAFAHDNQLSIGDKCVFELEAGEKDVMQVQILKESLPSFVSDFQSLYGGLNKEPDVTGKDVNEAEDGNGIESEKIEGSMGLEEAPVLPDKEVMNIATRSLSEVSPDVEDTTNDPRSVKEIIEEHLAVPDTANKKENMGAYPRPACCPQSPSIHVPAKSVTAPVADKMSKTCKDGHQFQIASQYGDRGSITSVCKVCMCARFEARVSSTNFSPCYHMRIPTAFVKLSRLSKEHEKVTLVDTTGRSWPIGFRYWHCAKLKMGYTICMVIGWKQFNLDNQLGLGDRCVFDLESGEKDIMQVRVLKA